MTGGGGGGKVYKRSLIKPPPIRDRKINVVDGLGKKLEIYKISTLDMQHIYGSCTHTRVLDMQHI